MKRRGLPKYVSEFQDRHGKWRYRARRTGFATLYFRAAPGTVDFENEYRAWRDGLPRVETGIGADRVRVGSVSDAIARYYRSTDWAGLAPGTQRMRRNILERFRQEHGTGPIAELQREHIKRLIEAKVETPAAGRNLLKVLRLLMRVAIDAGLRKDDPTAGVQAVRQKSEGIHSWTEEEIAAFEAAHPIGSRARLAFALLLYTGQRRGDVIGMGWQHLRQGRIHLRQQKTGATLAVAVHPELAAVLEQAPRDHLTFLTTAFGKPFTPAGFGNWFHDHIRDAGLPDRCAAHGLRKAAARRLAEAGCSASQIAAVTGHASLREVERYTKAAAQIVLADAAIGALAGPDREQNLANLPQRLAKAAEK
ncbi:MAG: tyrosine-type recombinase/integrase [Rhodospirillaceae bacterium]